MNIIEKENKVFSWCPNIEEGALKQIKNIANLPFALHCALMPDAHEGYSMPIGGVVSLVGTVVPVFVGYDIGCGMCAVKTSLKRADIIDREKRVCILDDIERAIPVGFAHNDDKRRCRFEESYRDIVNYTIEKTVGHNRSWGYNLAESWFNQISSLGGGNHFQEIQYDENDNVWIMIHSGSRNIGHKIATYFHEKAIELNKKWYSAHPIGFLPTSTTEGKEYIAYMNFALQFAFYNRKQMMSDVQDVLQSYFGGTIKFEKMINIHHNYASLENHLGKNVWVHRKGATLADKKTIGIIPGSMGTSSYIVRGLGNKLSLNSCSHGAGRCMGRMEFNRQNQDKINSIKEELKDIVYSDFSRVKKGRKDLDMFDVSEVPGAYKDIEEVMNNQKDLVEIVHTLNPLIVVKG
jgi:tRNA-splicing ligase RtcB (3'-phosphate/5'-hydroxy nucleic acid ligase)